MAQQETKPEKRETKAALGPAAKGMEWVYNRLPIRFEKFHNGLPYTWGPNETVQLPAAIADWMERHSAVSLEPVTGVQVLALVTPSNPDFGVPYTEDLGPEYLSRAVTDNYIQRHPDGMKTHAAIVPVAGGGHDNGRPIAATSRLSG